jgi:hypothetical protein
MLAAKRSLYGAVNSPWIIYDVEISSSAGALNNSLLTHCVQDINFALNSLHNLLGRRRRMMRRTLAESRLVCNKEDLIGEVLFTPRAETERWSAFSSLFGSQQIAQPR